MFSRGSKHILLMAEGWSDSDAAAEAGCVDLDSKEDVNAIDLGQVLAEQFPRPSPPLFE